MNKTMALAVTLTALAQPLLAQTRTTQPKAGAQVADEALARAFKANDVEALVAVYAPDAVLFPPGAMAQRGRDAIRRGLTDFLSQFRITDFIVTDSHYETSGDLSSGWGLFTITAVSKTSSAASPVRWEGRFTSVARRINGKWLLVSDHASLPMGAPPLAPRPVSNPTR
jgi:uncharacterized protein (TIGR02246 family)